MKVILRNAWTMCDAKGVSEASRNVTCPAGEYAVAYINHPRRRNGPRWFIVREFYFGAPEDVWLHWANTANNGFEFVVEGGAVR